MWVALHIQILLFILRHQQCHHACQISLFPVYWRGQKCIIMMQVFTHRRSVQGLQECGWMCSCICYCICYSYLKVSAGSLCWLDLERKAGSTDCRQRSNLSPDTWTDYETTGNWAQTRKKTPTPVKLAKDTQAKKQTKKQLMLPMMRLFYVCGHSLSLWLISGDCNFCVSLSSFHIIT